ncbi:hypothetical protein DHEL01_v209818 [Diaporthe helianthi]|uniref:Uncharacterized protein n=1 Tax=Diaporthe helianthi TaxID=158607 RepID=A0A2P5HNF2_DIAHE|nr:hypothetical protein DHEL01_v209818 [Diaporthe helianthi]
MGGLNHETWRQPPASLNVEWPTLSAFKDGPSLEEQKYRMRETREKVRQVITASGFIAPPWPEVGQQVKWTSTNTSLGDGLANLTSRWDGQSSSTANGIPLRFQTSIADRTNQTPVRSIPSEEDRSSVDQHESPLLQLLGRRRERSQQPQSNNPNNTPNLLSSGGIRNYHIDPSIFNPRIYVVELPDHMFLRTPPAAPRAMLKQMSSAGHPLRCGRPRRQSDTTETSIGSDNTRHARGYSSSTNDTHHTIEPSLLDCTYEHECTSVCGSSEITINDKGLKAPSRSRKQSSAATLKADSLHVLDTPRVIRPPPGFEPHKTPAHGTIAQLSPSVIPPDYDHTPGGWSQSRIWFSEEERLRLNFARMQEKAHHLGLDKSPFLPETVGEYAALLAERKAAEAKRIRKKIQQNEREARSQQDEETLVSHRSQLINANCLFFGEALIDEFVQTAPPPPLQIQLFEGNRMTAGLSQVLAMETCFNEIPADAPESERVDWPPDVEFKNWKGFRPRPLPGFARRRGSSYRGVWPFPRINVPFRPYDYFPKNEIPYSERKMILAPRWDWMSRFSKMLPVESHIPAAEPFLGDISLLLPSDLFL